MSVFDEIIEISDNDEFFNNQWIEWDHFLIPNKPELLRKIIRYIMAIFKHCKTCTVLDGCYFIDSNKPKQPLHENCHCDKKFISIDKVKKNSSAFMNSAKLNNYIFNFNYVKNGKQGLFQKWGYGVKDIDILKNVFEIQALENYRNGKYILKNLDEYGQRLAIPIDLQGKIFYSGWMVYPEGKIQNTTPFGGWANERK